MGILTLWYSSAAELGCKPSVAVRQDLMERTLCSRVSTETKERVARGDVAMHTNNEQRRYRKMFDKGSDCNVPGEIISLAFSKRSVSGAPLGEEVFIGTEDYA
ncbi:unnamed protein product, partial [Discosporangium mesarthrocarpum]